MNILAKSDNRHKYHTASHRWCKAVDICSCSLICLNFPFYRCFLTENEWRYMGLQFNLTWLVSRKFYQGNKLLLKINIYKLLYRTSKEYLQKLLYKIPIQKISMLFIWIIPTIYRLVSETKKYNVKKKSWEKDEHFSQIRQQTQISYCFTPMM